MLESADSRFASAGLPADQMARASLAGQFWPHGVAIPATAVPAGVAVPVMAAQGRWLVMCPNDTSAQYASKTDRRFFCGECGNVTNGGRWLPVTWPDPQTVADIERALTVRTEIRTQNWLPGEPVTQLIAENDRHNIRTPDDLRARHPGGG